MRLELVDVALRDGLQPIAQWVPTGTKIDMMRRLHKAGIRRAEVTAFVSDSAVPQLSDAAEVVAAANALPGFDPQVLVPTARRAAAAVEAGARHLAFVVSVSEAHNRNNVRRSPKESVADFRTIVAGASEGTRFRINLGTAFDCPFEGAVRAQAVLDLIEDLLAISADVEIALCDTTGRASPDRVAALCRSVLACFPDISGWAFHGHDTYGLGVANVLAAWSSGITVIDASVAGLGGCPFAPGATGNVATEDVVWTFQQMGIESGIDLDMLIDLAADSTRLPSAMTGGRVRDALLASRQRRKPAA